MLEYHLRKDWPQIVGHPIAAHTRPDAIKFRKLWIVAENSVWHQQLLFLKPMLFEKIRAFPQGFLISDLAFRIGEIPCFPNSVPPPSLHTNPSPEILEFARETTQSIQNPRLRDSLTKTIAKALSTKGGSGVSP